MPDDETTATPAAKPAFMLFGQSWQPREFISYGEWAAWGELPGATARIDALQRMFVDPSWEAFVASVDVRAFDAALIQLWAAVRMPPDVGEG